MSGADAGSTGAGHAQQLSWALVRRPWTVLVVALCVAALTGAGWLLWFSANTGLLLRVGPSGGTVTVEGTRYQLVELYSADQLQDVDGGEPQLPEPHTSFVVARLAVDTRATELAEDVDPADPFVFCGVELLGPDAMSWRAQAPVVSRAEPSTCEHGREQVLEQVFTVPSDQLDQLRGLVVPHRLGPGTDWVLRPA